MFITVNQVQLYYVKSGHGPALILLHGNGENHHLFDQLRRELSTRYTVYALDSRRHGLSQEAPVSYNLMMHDVAAFIRRLQLERATVLGFSDGGIVALLLAIHYPTRINKLVVAGANLTPQGLRRSARALFAVSANMSHDPLIQMMRNEPNISLRALKRIQAPTLVLAGSRDLIDRKETLRIAANIPNATLTIVPHANHSSYIRDNAQLLHLVQGFL
ncbi:alpha/beta fold hydrolase [Lacticaseibacillus saniviri]|uniref:Alpha beta superfamily hydrolase n=1 Tax=Lacticaseibacillus saniviri JCM 17471 = DSM 24301 TaxID=1293598 RepID=A0A0R2MTS3_9LACO|nr:alpha/beta hydrolase [Lacticaseibacillus saniviri]KRO16284.1 Alpha beta superfamily hydrolase [Lacticaseibacillus saniviri JCM 17471 = DSM 24301]MCG4281850.1 alpha/beta hydrolase [Lacticaseibacillus saniviri]